MGDRLIRVFPRRTNATPIDNLAYCGLPDFWAEADQVHVSVTFPWDLDRAEWLAQQWKRVAPVEVGGPAIEPARGPFVAGRYLRPGFVITSRGCPNRCRWCRVWQAGPLQELPITDGWIVQDDNLLACSPGHVGQVFRMLARQDHWAEFRGGFEAARLRDWHIELLLSLRPQPVIWFSYDDGQSSEWDFLREAVARLRRAEFSFRGHRLRCYVLIGQPHDSPEYAEDRLKRVLSLGLTPMAMLYRDDTGQTDSAWRRLQRSWARPAAIHAARRS